MVAASVASKFKLFCKVFALFEFACQTEFANLQIEFV